jgi:hypothetical protein
MYKDVLDEILSVQKNNPNLICYLQPYKNEKIRLLCQKHPAKNKPIRLYLSTTDNLKEISYIANIVGWENKKYITQKRLACLKKHMINYQKEEKEIYLEIKGKPCVNLISILNLEKLTNPFPVSNLIKVKDGLRHKTRTQAGGWTPVYELPEWLGKNKAVSKEEFDSELEKGIEKSKKDSNEERRKRLLNANKKPQQVTITSQAFVRNPDVIVEVMLRADGNCERCKSKAPFIRVKNNSPYLEIHHWTLLSEGGEDTIENAGALCPNCHRELHFGKIKIKEKI